MLQIQFPLLPHLFKVELLNTQVTLSEHSICGHECIVLQHHCCWWYILWCFFILIASILYMLVVYWDDKSLLENTDGGVANTRTVNEHNCYPVQTEKHTGSYIVVYWDDMSLLENTDGVWSKIKYTSYVCYCYNSTLPVNSFILLRSCVRQLYFYTLNSNLISVRSFRAVLLHTLSTLPDSTSESEDMHIPSLLTELQVCRCVCVSECASTCLSKQLLVNQDSYFVVKCISEF